MRVNLRKTLFILPNLFTLSSIFCGFYAILLCVGEPDPEAFYRASWLILFAMFFDTIDGRVARLTKTQSAFGVQIDSLADVVSFGAAPAVLVHQWSLHQLGFPGALAAFAFCACGAIRLARFNVLTMSPTGAPKKPSKWFVGLPIPGAAGGLVSLVIANHHTPGRALATAPWIVLGAVLLLAFFMVSTVKFRSFKDMKLNARTVLLLVLGIGSSAIVAFELHASFALVWMMLTYIGVALAESVVRFSRKRLGRPIADEEEEPVERKI